MPAWPGVDKRRAVYRRGRLAEQQALEYLQAQGLELIECNYRASCGEIDIIMRDGNTLVFVEVRYRTNENFCRASETIDHHKQQRLRATGEHFLQRYQGRHTGDCRFDIVTLVGPAERTKYHWISNAF